MPCFSSLDLPSLMEVGFRRRIFHHLFLRHIGRRPVLCFALGNYVFGRRRRRRRRLLQKVLGILLCNKVGVSLSTTVQTPCPSQTRRRLHKRFLRIHFDGSALFRPLLSVRLRLLLYPRRRRLLPPVNWLELPTVLQDLDILDRGRSRLEVLHRLIVLLRWLLWRLLGLFMLMWLLLFLLWLLEPLLLLLLLIQALCSLDRLMVTY